MEIDWFTVTAQLVNFLILVWLLKRFLYGPIVDAMDAREERIAEQLESAEQLERDARDQIDEYEQKQEQLEARREDVLDEAREQAEAQRRELLEKARTEVERAKGEWYASLQREQRTVLDDIRSQTERQIFETIRRVLEDLADADLDRRIIEAFVTRVADLDESELLDFDGDDSGRRSLTVHTSVELSDDQHSRLADALQARFGEDARLSFEVDEELIGGIEVRARGRRFGWSIRQYLESLEHTLETRLQERLERPDTDESPEQVKETAAEKVS